MGNGGFGNWKWAVEICDLDITANKWNLGGGRSGMGMGREKWK